MIYNHIYYEKYSREGHSTVPQPLPDWINIEIFTEDNSKKVVVNSRIHVNKKVELPTCYSTEFKDTQILKDVSAEVAHRWL
jgi:hypothetical protein